MQERVDVRLDRTQVLWLTLGGVVALGLMFAFGFVLGQRAARIAAEPDGNAIARADAAHARQTAPAERAGEDLTFYDSLREPQTRRSVRPPVVPPPKPVQAPPAPAKPAKVDKPTKPAPASNQVASAVARARQSMQASQGKAKENGPGTLRAALDAGPAHQGEFTVQVSAFQSRGEANAYASGLNRKGYHPFVVESSIAGRGVWYRVRIGRFVTENEAERAKQMLASADIPAWVLRAD